MTMFFPSRYSSGQELPNGPRMPISAPSSISCNAEVTTPAFWTVNSTYLSGSAMMQFLWAIHPCRKWPYGFVVEVMSEVRRAGVDKLGMITELPEDRK